MGKLVSINGKGGRTERLAEAIREFANAIKADILGRGSGVSIGNAVYLAKQKVSPPEEGMIIDALGDLAEAILQAVEACYARRLADEIDALRHDVYDVTDDVRDLQMDVMRLQDNGWGNRW